MELAERVEHVGSDPPKIRDTRIFPHPDAFFDARAEVLDEVSVKFRTNEGILSVGKASNVSDCHENLSNK
jgi:hypothetical protein